jgi:hypothetical protein
MNRFVSPIVARQRLSKEVTSAMNTRKSRVIFGRLIFLCYPCLSKGESMCLFVYSLVSKSSYITTDGQSASLSWSQAPISDPRPICFFCIQLFLDSYGFSDVMRPLWREAGSDFFFFLLDNTNSEFHRTHEHIILLYFLRLPQTLEGHVPGNSSFVGDVFYVVRLESNNFFKLFISNQNYIRFYKLICWDSIYDLKRLIQW